MNGAGLLLAFIAGAFAGALSAYYIARATALAVIDEARDAYRQRAELERQRADAEAAEIDIALR